MNEKIEIKIGKLNKISLKKNLIIFIFNNYRLNILYVNIMNHNILNKFIIILFVKINIHA
jgi:hypothetical protein